MWFPLPVIAGGLQRDRRRFSLFIFGVVFLGGRPVPTFMSMRDPFFSLRSIFRKPAKPLGGVNLVLYPPLLLLFLQS